MHFVEKDANIYRLPLSKRAMKELRKMDLIDFLEETMFVCLSQHETVGR